MQPIMTPLSQDMIAMHDNACAHGTFMVQVPRTTILDWAVRMSKLERIEREQAAIAGLAEKPNG